MTYHVNVTKAPKGHAIPPLLADVGAWIKEQQHGDLGWFDSFALEAIPKTWDSKNAARLQKEGFAFLALPEGSLLALVRTGDASPAAVVLLGSEGESRTIANSLEEFLSMWSKTETTIDELDDEDGAAGRKALGKWLRDKKVKAPKAKDFDFQAWLDSGDGRSKAPAAAAAPQKTVARAPTAAMKALGPKARAIASLVGLRADAPELVSYITKVLGKKAPQSSSESSDGASVGAPKAGVEMSFSHSINNDAYPPIHKTAKSFIPYLEGVWLTEKFAERVLRVPYEAATEQDVIAVLGAPSGKRAMFADEDEATIPFWVRELDAGAGVELEIVFRKHPRVRISVASAASLEEFPDVTTGLFVGYAATHGLLDESRFAAHADLLAQIKKRKAKGSDLVKAALSRGLWDDHLKNDPELRKLAYRWFHNMNSMWITGDLKKVFGKRVGKYDHDEPKLDDDTWEAVDKASKILDARFAPWIGKRKGP